MLSNEIMYKALVDKDSTYEGSFIAAVKTTGIFCRPTCTARKPKLENVEFYSTAKEAILKGYRPRYRTISSCGFLFKLVIHTTRKD